MKIAKYTVLAALIPAVIAGSAAADERHFAYSYEAETLHRGEVELAQWLTHRAGREGGDFGKWELREEVEYGLTSKLSTALYLNFEDTYFNPDDDAGGEEENEFEFAGVSSEWKYQILDPRHDLIGIVLYGEATYDSDEAELEEKLIFSKNFGTAWTAALNASVEQEWEDEGSETEETGVLEFTGGLAYGLNKHWSLGVEVRNVREYANLDLSDEEIRAWYVGPVLAFKSAGWWATLAVMPQIGLEGARDLENQERINVRLLVGKEL